jgi:hypothetical protein
MAGEATEEAEAARQRCPQSQEEQVMVDATQVEQRSELAKSQSIEIGTALGGITIASVADLARVADTLSRGEIAVPIHCRGKPGVCFALAMQALEWGVPVMSVITKSYVPRGGDRIGYESQLLHAVVEKNAPIKGRLRYEIIGEGDERRCKVWATFNGEDKPHEYISEPLFRMHPGYVTKEVNGETIKYVKGSQLWDTRPEVQMFYDASRQWARLFCPDVLLGAYTSDELQGDNAMLDVTPKLEALSQRLRDAKQTHTDRGFDPDHVMREAAVRSTTIEGDQQEVTNERSDEPTGEGRQDQSADRAEHGTHQGGGDHAGGADQAVGQQPAAASAKGEDQGEIFPPDRKPSKPKPKPPARRR